MRLAVAIYALIAMTHYGVDFIGGFYPDPGLATRVWFYIFRGVEGSVLFLLPILAKRLIVPSFALATVLTWGAVEEAMTAACMLSKPIQEMPSLLPFSGLCGDDWYLAGCFTALVIGAIILDHGRKK